MEEPKKLKDLRWFLMKDLGLYNKPLPKDDRWGLFDLVAFDVPTTLGPATMIYTLGASVHGPMGSDSTNDFFIIFNDGVTISRISIFDCVDMNKVGEIDLPFDIGEERFVKKAVRVIEF